MSDKSNANEALAKQRLLKANNVQRRRFEKLADEVINRANSNQVSVRSDAKAVLYNQQVEKAMGGELKKLLEIRAKIQSHKQEIEKLRKIGDIKRRLNKRGIKCSTSEGWDTNYRGVDYGHFDFYLDPPAVDEKSEDVCENIVGNPLVQMRLMDCPNNPPYASYQEEISGLTATSLAFDEACEELRSDIWAVVTTEDIQSKLTQFKGLWL